LRGRLPEVFAPHADGTRRIAVAATRVCGVTAGSGSRAGAIRRRRFTSTTDGGVSIAGDLDSPAGVAVVGAYVFYSVRGVSDLDGSIHRCDVTGANKVLIAAGQARPLGIAADTTHVYWANRLDGTIHRARWDGSEHEEIVQNLGGPNAVAVDVDGIYWTEAGTDPDLLDGRLMRADHDGQHPVVLASPLLATSSIAVDGAFVYASARGSLANGYRDGVVVKVRKP
jgi:hypothetical protein